MLSALSATQHALQFNNPSACSYDRSSPFLPRSSYLTLPAMQGKPLQTSGAYVIPLDHTIRLIYRMVSACSNAGSPKVRPCVTSPHDMFRVFGYTPHEGAAGISIVVNVQFTFMSDETTFLRIVVGNRALSTAVRASASKRECEWDLQATVPDFETATSTGFPSSTVPLTVQALNNANVTLDSLTFGKFTYTRQCMSPLAFIATARRLSEISYTDAAPSPLLLCKKENEDLSRGPATASNSPDLSIPGMPSSSHRSALSPRTSRPTSSSGSSRGRTINTPIPSKEPHSVRGQPKKQSLIRARRAGSEDDDPDNNYRAVLAIETPIDSMAKVEEWDADERRIGRRLVRFTRVQDGCTLHVVCEAIRPSDYTEGDTVVSCIHRPSDISGSGDAPASQCCITSVDIIFLLECLVGEIFNIEEKNRIRRNLEGFRPKTVSKNKSGTEDFFQKIMDFPTPKPRNIEKDVKVFDWAVLPQALDKIISKYVSSARPHRSGLPIVYVPLDVISCYQEARRQRDAAHCRVNGLCCLSVLHVLACSRTRLCEVPRSIVLLPSADVFSASVCLWLARPSRQQLHDCYRALVCRCLRQLPLPLPPALSHALADAISIDAPRLSPRIQLLVPLPIQRAVS